MNYLKDVVIVNRKAIPKMLDRLMKFWYVVPILALSAFVWSAIISPSLGGGLVGRLFGYVIQVVGGGCLLYLMRQAIHDGKIYDWKLFNGVRYYARPIFIYLMVLNLTSYGISLLTQFASFAGIFGLTLAGLINMFLGILLSAVIEYIYLTNKSEEQIFNDYGHFIKENFLVWFAPILVFQILVNNVVGFLFTFVGFYPAYVIMMLLHAAFYFYRASIFEEVVDTSVRKRAFMRLM